MCLICFYLARIVELSLNFNVRSDLVEAYAFNACLTCELILLMLIRAGLRLVSFLFFSSYLKSQGRWIGFCVRSGLKIFLSLRFLKHMHMHTEIDMESR